MSGHDEVPHLRIEPAHDVSQRESDLPGAELWVDQIVRKRYLNPGRNQVRRNADVLRRTALDEICQAELDRASL